METEVTFWGRLMGYGSLIVESSADQPLKFRNVASLSKVQATLNQLIRDERERTHRGRRPPRCGCRGLRRPQGYPPAGYQQPPPGYQQGYRASRVTRRASRAIRRRATSTAPRIPATPPATRSRAEPHQASRMAPRRPRSRVRADRQQQS